MLRSFAAIPRIGKFGQVNIADNFNACELLQVAAGDVSR